MSKNTPRLAVAVLTASLAVFSLIQGEEGTGPTQQTPAGPVALAYPDPALGWEKPTICAGHTLAVFRGQRATPAQCETWLREDVSRNGEAIKRCSPNARLSQQQYDVLVSIVHNIGGANYCRSQLAREVNANHCAAAARQINAAPQLQADGQPRRWQGPTIATRSGRVLLRPGDYVNKWTTSGGQPLTGLILRREKERSLFEADCDAQ